MSKEEAMSLVATASFLSLSSRAWKDHLAYGLFMVRGNLSFPIAKFSRGLVQSSQDKETKKIPVLEYCLGEKSVVMRSLM